MRSHLYTRNIGLPSHRIENEDATHFFFLRNETDVSSTNFFYPVSILWYIFLGCIFFFIWVVFPTIHIQTEVDALIHATQDTTCSVCGTVREWVRPHRRAVKCIWGQCASLYTFWERVFNLQYLLVKLHFSFDFNFSGAIKISKKIRSALTIINILTTHYRLHLLKQKLFWEFNNNYFCFWNIKYIWFE